MCLCKNWSNGNYYGLGSRRKAELWESCRTLGLPDENITLMKITNMPDNPNVKWDPNRTYEIIMNHVEQNSITQVYTFDFNGVSRHANHRSLYFAFANMSIRNVIPRYLQVYLLESVNIFRKYTMFFDSFVSYVMSKHILMVTLDEFRTIQVAMRKHRSQMAWYRWLYVDMSRYMYMNTYKALDRDDAILMYDLYGEFA
uniref:N-acetylglucosaminylphosphatidylinositol deacetylase n=1 Tax=Homalodisca liturata TaxID=320908 RepID=A0A1B6K680_9HEMI